MDNPKKANFLVVKKWSIVGGVLFCVFAISSILPIIISISNLHDAFTEMKADTLTFVSSERAKKRGSLLTFKNDKNALIRLSCATPGSGGSHTCALRRPLSQGEILSISWVSIRNGIASSTNYPISISDNQGINLIHTKTESSIQKKCWDLLLLEAITWLAVGLFFGLYFFYLIKALKKGGTK